MFLHQFLIILNFLYVCQLANFLIKIRQIQGYIQFCMRYLSEIFLRHYWDVSTLVPNTLNFLCVSQSVSFTEIRQIQGYIQFWMIYLSDFLDIPRILIHQFQRILNFVYVCQSVCLLTSLLKLYKGISPDMDEIFLWNFLKAFLRYWYTGSN